MEAVSRFNTRRLVWTALLSAVATVLMYLDTALPIFPRFLKFDLSDLPPLIAAFAYGPVTGVLCELVKNLIHMLTTSSAGIGQLANFLMGSALVIPAGMIYRADRTKKGAIKGLLAGTVFTTIIAAFANYFVLLPFYSHLMPIEKIISMSSAVIPAIHDKLSLIIYGVVPFNILKGAVVSLLTFKLYKRMSALFRE
ncbi:MAG: ECF transporter S component [Synergistaceae bacterium]|nr:ECF transporter S component [Synergistota bacterium]NLM71317.1 ECF transporter S component [Synergistaceae bacterium]